MNEPLIKIYGFFETEDETQIEHCLQELHLLCEAWYLDKEVFSLEDSMIHISYEGNYFPHEESAKIFGKYISEKSSGKMDVIDLEGWTLERFFLEKKYNKELFLQRGMSEENIKQIIPYSKKSSLNYALEASQEKNGSGLFKAKIE